MDYIIDRPDDGLFRVHRSTMTSDEVLAAEKERIFDRCWLYACHDSEIGEPGAFITREVAERPLLIVRDADGEVRCWLNTCTHRGAQVCREGSGVSKRFTCFYHGWTFNNSGELISLPGEDAYQGKFDRTQMGLVAAPRFEQYKGFWFVSFNPNIESLADYLADAKEYLDLVADQSTAGMEVIGGNQKYSIGANWKLLVENSTDGYHAATAHATYFGFLKDIGTDLSPGITGGARDLGNGHSVVEYKAPWGRPVARWEAIWGEDAKDELAEIRARLVAEHGEEKAARMCDTNRNLSIFPNLIINDIMAITIRTFWPQKPDYQTVAAWALGPEGEEDHLRARRLDSFLTFLGPGGFATPDDIECLESCQKGYRTQRELEWNDISRGVLSDTPATVDEHQMRAFWRRWNDLMTGGSVGDRATAGKGAAK